MTTPPKPASPSQRQAALRERRSREGLVRLEVWARAEDHQVIKEFAAKLEKRRRIKNLPTWGE